MLLLPGFCTDLWLVDSHLMISYVFAPYQIGHSCRSNLLPLTCTTDKPHSYSNVAVVHFPFWITDLRSPYPSNPIPNTFTTFTSNQGNHIILWDRNHRKAPEGSASFSAQRRDIGQALFSQWPIFFSQQGELLLAISVSSIQRVFKW